MSKAERDTMKGGLHWFNISTFASVYVMAAIGVYYMARVHFSWTTFYLGIVSLVIFGLGITAGYHRLFAHQSYKARKALQGFLLFVGAGAFQGTALEWCRKHRDHHTFTDKKGDPYSRVWPYQELKGFLWAHMGSFLWKDLCSPKAIGNDLRDNPLVRLQSRHYLPLAGISGLLAPMLVGVLWDDPAGALFVSFIRIGIHWQVTFFVNSLAHLWGTTPLHSSTTARNNWVVGLLTLGEGGGHDEHHAIPWDFRAGGLRWWYFDPTKWFIRMLSVVGLTYGLRIASREYTERMRQRGVA